MPAIVFPIVTSRLVIRPMELRDADQLFDAYADGQALQHLTSQLPSTPAETREYVAATIARHTTDHQLSRWTVILSASGQIVGDVGLQREDFGNGVEVGLVGCGGREFWQHGLGLEAATVAIDAGFCQLDLNRIVAATAPANRAAQSLLSRLGLRRHGTSQDGRPLFMITRDEFAVRTQPRARPPLTSQS